jgi:pimeloyl-ACP methyl ester carboxylesterase
MLPCADCQRWIFLRGLGRHSQHWGCFPDRFRRAFPAAEIELLDMAGTGSEAARDSYLNIGDYAGDLRRRSRFVREGKTPFAVLAISMGAMIASAWAERYPGEVGRMVLINTSSRADSRFYQRLRWRIYRRFLQMMAHGNDLLFQERVILRMTARGLPHMEALAEEQAGMVQTTLSNCARQILASARYGFPDRPECPVLFLAAEQDQMVDPVCSRRLAARWRAKLDVHPQGDHDLPLLEPDWVVKKVWEFCLSV